MSAVRPSVVIAGRAISTFQICGTAGFAAAVAVAVALAAHLGLSVGWIAVLSAAAAASFFALAIATWASLGVERLVFYRHELVVLASVAVASAASGRRALAYLDVTAIALGVFLAIGRIGCTAVGCCHGRPARHGLRYGNEHVAAGFAPWLVGVPLVPVQLVESASVAALTATAAARLWTGGGAPAGAVLAWQLTSYALLRFVFELARGDGERPAWRGLSEAQGTAVALAVGIAAAEWAGALPPSTWHPAAAAVLAGAAGMVMLRRRRARLLGPAHVAEIARVVQGQPAASPADVPVATTSLGVRLSASAVPGAPGGATRVYTVSGVDARTARQVASLIVLLDPPARAATDSALVEGRPGMFHLIVTSAGGH